jgi:ADP-heptose:LPS heptosyltransferase
VRPGLGFAPHELNICANFGGMGDMIGRLPALKHVHENYPHVSMTVFWHDYFVELAEFLMPSTPRCVHWKFSEMPLANERQPLVDFNPERINSLALHLTDQAFLVIMDRLPTREAARYILAPPASRPELPEKYVVITCGYTAYAREWKPQYINETADKLIELGYTPVFLGSAKDQPLGNKSKIKAEFSEEVDYSKGINLINKTSLIEALGIIQGAKAVLGVDNGLLHLASCTTTPVVWGFTSVEPEVRLPASNGPQGVVRASDQELSCSGCQSKQFYIKHDFRTCLFKDYKCLDFMTADRFISEFKRVTNWEYMNEKGSFGPMLDELIGVRDAGG